MASDRINTKSFQHLVVTLFACLCLSTAADAGVITITAGSNGVESSTPIDGELQVKILPVDTLNPVTVTYQIKNVSDSAIEGADYSTIATKEVVILAGDSSAPISINVLNDDIIEDTEKVSVTITGWSGGSGHSIDSSNDTAEITIADDDIASLSISDESVSESAGTMTFTVSIGAGQSIEGPDVTVTYAMGKAGDTATASDYDSTTTGTAIISAGSTSTTFNVPITADNVVEADETFTAILSAPSANATLSDSEGTGTITDVTIASLSISDESVSESAGTMTFTVSIGAGQSIEGPDVTVTYAMGKAGDTATASDYDSTTTGTAIISAGSTSTTFNVPITADNVVEADETFTAILSAPSANATLSDSEGTGTITDVTIASLSISDESVSESAGTMTFTVSIGAGQSIEGPDVTVTYAMGKAGDTATASDYDSTTTGTAIISAGSTSTTFNVPITADNVVEADETFTAILSAPSANATLSDSEGTGTITDVTIASLSISDESVSESAGTMTFTVSIGAGQSIEGPDVTVTYAMGKAGDTATASDYDSTTTGTAIISAGSTSTTFNVPITADNVVEADETFTAILSAPSANATLSDSEGTGTITDVTIASLSISDESVSESAGTMTFTVSIGAGQSIEGPDVTVTYAMGKAGDTATASDYDSTTTGTAIISAGSTSTTFNVPITADNVVEADETFTAILSAPSANATLSDSEGTGTITDVTIASLSISDESVSESAGTMTFTVSIGAGQSIEGPDVTVTYAMGKAGDTATASDYDSTTTGTAIISAGSTSTTFNVPITADNVVEADETFTAILSAPSANATLSDSEGTGTITDVTIASLSISDESVSESAGTMTFTVSIGAGQSIEGPDVTVTYAMGKAGDTATASDYDSTTTGTAIISAGSTSTTFNVPITADNVVEADETFTAILSAPSANATLSDSEGTGTITDVTIASLSISDESVSESAGTMTFTVSIGAGQSIEGPDVTVTYAMGKAGDTATASDYDSTTTGTATISAGSTSTTFNVPITADNVVEADETFTAILSAPSANATLSDSEGTGTITDDDDPVLSISLSSASSSVPEGNSGDLPQVVYTVQSSLTVAADAEVTFDYTITTGEVSDISNTGTSSGSIIDGTSIDIAVEIIGDDIVEGDEPYTITISNPQIVNSSSSASIALAPNNSGAGTLLNDDIPTLTINDSSVSEGRTGTTDAGFLITTDLEIAADTTVSFDWAVVHGPAADITEDDDFAAGTPISPATLLESLSGVAAGGSVPLPLLIAADFIVEDDENYAVELSNGSISGDADGVPDTTDAGIGKIVNDEHWVTMSPGAGVEITYSGTTAAPTTSVDVVIEDGDSPIFTVAVLSTCDHVDTITVNPLGLSDSYTKSDDSVNYTFTVTQDETIAATSAVDIWTVTTQILGQQHGTITPTNTFTGCPTTWPLFEVITDTSTTPPHHISEVEVDGGYTEGIAPQTSPFSYLTFSKLFDPAYQTDVTNYDHTINAAFTQIFTLIEASPFGYVAQDLDPGSDISYLEVGYGINQDFDITALTCSNGPGHIHHISDIIIDGTSTGIRGTGAVSHTQSFTGVDADHTVEVQFTGWVDVTINGPGRVRLGSDVVTGTGSIEYEADTPQTFEILQNSGYHITKVEVDGIDVGRVSEYTFDEEAPKDHTIYVEFDIDFYSIEATSTYNTVYLDSGENIVATTQYPTFGSDSSFYVDLNDPSHGIQAVFIDNVSVILPTAGSTTIDPLGVYVLTNTADDTLEIKFTSIDASHRVVVVDYDVTPISDVPLVASSVTAPANVMFIIDDSGSMHWSVMVPGSSEGKYSGYTSILEPGGEIPNNYRMQWKSQWSEYNRMYYNPDVTYVPWPRVVNVSQTVGDLRTSADADTYAPRFHPLDSSDVLVLRNSFASLAGTGVVKDENQAILSDPSHWGYETNYDSFGDDNYHASNTNPGAGQRSATWTFTTGIAGNYDVYVSWEDSGSREEVDYIVSCTSCSPVETYTETVDQTINGRPYNGDPSYYIGSYPFPGSATVTVTMRDTVGGPYTSSIDAVKLSYGGVRIPNAHYYVWSDSASAPYLVTFDDTTNTIRYYLASGTSIDNGVDNQDDVVNNLVEDTTPPADVQVMLSYADALQNFANWVTYYRERRCAAIAGVARSLVKMEGVQVGLSPLWTRTESVNDVVPLMKIKVDGEDFTDDILEVLYEWNASGGTPLMDALEEVGQYYQNSDINDWSRNLPSPYYSEAEGGACQQCFAIMMTDGFYNSIGFDTNDNRTDIGNSNYVDRYDDDDDNTAFADAAGDTLYSSLYEDTLADIAMHFYETDLHPGLTNKVKTSPEETETYHDIADWQHMVTYTVSFGLQGTLDPANYELRTTATTPDYPDWPQPSANQPSTIDDLWHAAVNGRGKFLNATNPDELVKSLLAVVENIAKRTGSAASVSINGDKLFETISSQVRMYQTSYNTSSWYGDLKSYKLVTNATEAALHDANNDGVFDTSEWSASTMMASTLPSSRNIFTNNGGGKIFSIGNLSNIQQEVLTPYFSFTSNSSTDVLSYIRGETTYEGTTFRNRVEPLGDFVNSQATFEDDVLYVGGNDGMLHAFNANNGSELFAYVPGLVYQDLRELANPAYSHKFYVDNTPFVQKFSSTFTLLVGGLGKGGKGYYGLDVSTPASFDAADVLWEYPTQPATLVNAQTTITFSNPGGGNDLIRDSAAGFTSSSFDTGKYITVVGADCSGYSNNGTFKILNKNSNSEIEIAGGSLVDTCGDGEAITITESISDPGIGYSFSDAVIVKTNDSSIGTGALAGYVVIFGNGYASEDGTAQLYILNPTTGVVIEKIDTGIGPTNGLSTPKVVDVDNDLKADYVYAGDLLGNMWKFDLTSSNHNGWQVAFCDNADDRNEDCQAIGAAPKPLFKGLSNQPITAAPDVMRHPTYSGYMVIYGTGKFIGTPDLESTHLQSFYGLWDWAPDEYDHGYLGERIDSLEDIDGDGRLDVDEDLNGNGTFDSGEDLDSDNNFDVDEDLNGNGLIDALTDTILSNSPARDIVNNPKNTLKRQEIIVENMLTEDTNGDGQLDTVNEDLNGNNVLDPGEDVDGDGRLDVDEDIDDDGYMDTYSYLRIPTSYIPNWVTSPTIDVNFDNVLDDKDKVPQYDLGWYFDLPGQITDTDSVDNDNDGTVDEAGERALGERVTSDTIIRDGKAIMISFGVTGSTCNVGMFSFLNERNAVTGGSFGQAVLDINGDGIVNELDMVLINFDGEYGLPGVPTDNAYEGRIFNPAILQDPENPGVEKKFMSSSSGQIETITEKGERRGIYYWQQIE